MIKKCKYCNKEFEPYKRSKNIQIYCSSYCGDRAYKQNNKDKINLQRTERRLADINKHNDWAKEYRKNNRNMINEKRKTYKRLNRNKIIETKFVDYHRNEIVKLIGNKCAFCNRINPDFHHMEYNHLPRENLKDYCKFIIPLCRSHHSMFHRMMKRQEYRIK